jgi:xylulose-5-phosphate/fructose-6-phosphate phosphoketolase
LVAAKKDKLIKQLTDKIEEHKKYIGDIGDDMPEVKEWKWE